MAQLSTGAPSRNAPARVERQEPAPVADSRFFLEAVSGFSNQPIPQLNVADIERDLKNPPSPEPKQEPAESISDIGEQTPVAKLQDEKAPLNFSLKQDITRVSQLEQPLPAPAPAQPAGDPNYIIPPRSVPNARVNPITTTLLLNGTPVSHLTEFEVNGGYIFGYNRSEQLDINFILRLKSEVEQSLSRQNIFTSDQRGIYVQLQTVRADREVTITRKDPQTLNGLQMQMTFTGSLCTGPNASQRQPDDQCTLIPALVTDRNSIDPRFFVPTRIVQPGFIGDFVTPETRAILAQPGFQNVGAKGEILGLDLYFPNTGATPGNTQTDKSSIEREEVIDTNLALGFSRVRQILRANHTEGVIGRTIHGYELILGDRNFGVNSAIQLGAQFLPDLYPNIDGTPEPVSTNINRNLFLAANNTRLPANSFTVYQAGLGSAPHPRLNQEGKPFTPDAKFNSIWLGLSPVTERDLSSEIVGYQATGPERVALFTGGEGGIDSDVSFVSAFNGQTVSSGNLQDFYAQIYITTFNRDVNYVTRNTFREETTYYPHLSLTGNITSVDSAFRYYGGVIASPDPKLYIGTDYSKFRNLWSYSAGGLLYNQSDREYFSNVRGNVTRRFPLSRKSSLNLFASSVYAFDPASDPIDNTTASFVAVGAGFNYGPFSAALTQYIGDILPESIDTGLGVNLGLNIENRFFLSGYLTPGNGVTGYGASARYKFGRSYYSPTIIFGWQREAYDYGEDPLGNNLSTTNDTFTILFRLGSPANPFDPQTAQKLRQETEREEERQRREQIRQSE